MLKTYIILCACALAAHAGLAPIWTEGDFGNYGGPVMFEQWGPMFDGPLFNPFVGGNFHNFYPSLYGPGQMNGDWNWQQQCHGWNTGLPQFPNTGYFPPINRPTFPIQPIRPVGPVGPVGPIRPVGPVGPVGPVNPVVPVNPQVPIGPVNPVVPTVDPLAGFNPVDVKSQK